MAKGKREGVKKLLKEGSSITLACRLVGISRSGYYNRNKGGRSKGHGYKNVTLNGAEGYEPAIDEDIAEMIREIVNEHPTHGYRMVWAIMRYDRGIIINKKKIQRIMKLKGWQVKPIKRTKRGAGKFYEKEHKVVDPEDRVESMLPDMRWATDLTKIYVEETGWVNLIPVIDCCTR